MRILTLDRRDNTGASRIRRIELHHYDYSGYCVKAWYARHRQPFLNRAHLKLVDAKALIADIALLGHRLRKPRVAEPEIDGLSEWDPHEWAQVR